MPIGIYAKAIVGAIVAGLTALGTALSDGHVDPVEWVTVAIAALVTLGGVWAVPNASRSDDLGPPAV